LCHGGRALNLKVRRTVSARTVGRFLSNGVADRDLLVGDRGLSFNEKRVHTWRSKSGALNLAAL
jgi:hypothetical protein